MILENNQRMFVKSDSRVCNKNHSIASLKPANTAKIQPETDVEFPHFSCIAAEFDCINSCCVGGRSRWWSKNHAVLA